MLFGCSVIGPASISQGRKVYNEVINRTNDEQMLLALVRKRYGDSPSLLSVTNVTASLRFRSDTGVQVGVGSPSAFAGNLVPFSAGFAYEENPTISYVPVGGDLYLRGLLAPLPLEVVVGFLRGYASPGKSLLLVVERINDLANPGFLPAPSTAPDTRFRRLAELIETLHRAGVLTFATITRPNELIETLRGTEARSSATISKSTRQFALVIRGYAPDHLPEVRELMNLLSLSPVTGSCDIVVPMSLSVRREGSESIAITTRSVARLIEILTAAVDVPQEDVRSGRAVGYPPLGLVATGVRIRQSEEWPDDASVRVNFRDRWYYIADTDQSTKQFFRVVELLWGETIASTTRHQPAPVLTVPIGR